jgi:hypothetical protein
LAAATGRSASLPVNRPLWMEWLCAERERERERKRERERERERERSDQAERRMDGAREIITARHARPPAARSDAAAAAAETQFVQGFNKVFAFGI